MGRQVGRHRGRDDVVGSTDECSHAKEHDGERVGTQHFRIDGKDCQETHEDHHEHSNDNRTTSTESVTDDSDNDSTGHHTETVRGGDEIGLRGSEGVFQKVRKPKEESVVTEFEESERNRVLCHHGNLEGFHKTDRLGAVVLFLATLGFFGVLLLPNAHFRSNNVLVDGIRHELHRDERPQHIGECRNGQTPPVRPSDGKNRGGGELGGNVADVLMAGPQTKNDTAVLFGFGVTEPVAHYGGTDGTTGGLSETKDKVKDQNQNVTELGGVIFGIEPDEGVDGKQTNTGTKQTER
mmetsp:Transcript_20591/g.30520  ORF Transcript_20591/g.30520 Transcript_20591/m.30520 type:complete len:294 (-) Transcript_20591:381-1262(-)